MCLIYGNTNYLPEVSHCWWQRSEYVRYFANICVGLLFKSNVYFGMKTKRIDWTVLFVFEKGMGSLSCQFSQRYIAFQTQKTLALTIKACHFHVSRFIRWFKEFLLFLFIFHFLFYMYMENEHTLFTCSRWREQGRKIEISNIINGIKSIEVKIAELSIFYYGS